MSMSGSKTVCVASGPGRLDLANLIAHPPVDEYLRLVRERKSMSGRFSVASGSTDLR